MKWAVGSSIIRRDDTMKAAPKSQKPNLRLALSGGMGTCPLPWRYEYTKSKRMMAGCTKNNKPELTLGLLELTIKLTICKLGHFGNLSQSKAKILIFLF